MNFNTVVGIDPGSDGAIATIGLTPSTVILKNVTLISKNSTACKVFEDIDPATTIVAIEELHAIFGASAGSTFSLGKACGFWEGICCSRGIPYVLVPPKEWQEAVTKPPVKPKTRGLPENRRKAINKMHKAALKVESMRAASEIFPDYGIDHDGMADAINIARYIIYRDKLDKLYKEK